MLERVADLEQAAQLRGGALAYEDVPLERTGQNLCVLGAADEGGEEALGQIVPRKPRPDRAGAVVDDDRRIV